MYVAHERRAYILRLLEQHGHLRSADLARSLGVTDETIRTDLVELQRQGLLQRVHGGARYVLPTGKGAGGASGPDCLMADMLANHIRADMCLYLDAAPFSLLLAWRLRNKPCRIVSASPKLLNQLGAKAMAHRLFCPGGELDKTSGLIHPGNAAEFLQDMAPDVAVLRPASLDAATAGYPTPQHAAWAQAAAACAKRCYAAVPSAHLTAEAPCTFPCTPHLIFTEDNLPQAFAESPAVRTVPYISRESLLPADRFDY